MSTGAFFRDDEGRVCAHVTSFGSSLLCQMECLPNPLGFISHVHVGKKNTGKEIERCLSPSNLDLSARAASPYWPPFVSRGDS